MRRSSVALTALMSGAMSLVACGGGAAQKPAANLTGPWQLTMTMGENTCEMSAGEQESYSGQIAHTEGSNSFTLTGIGSGSVAGHIEGTRVAFAASVTTSECSPLAIQAEGTLDSAGNSFSGKASYTCKYTSGSCSGSGTMSGAREGSGPDGPAAQLCARMQTCGQVTSADLTTCESTLHSIEMYVVDPAQVSACLAGGTCQQVQDATFIQQCLAYDSSSFRCNGTTLHFCNTSAQCTDLACDSGCKNYIPGSRSASCGYDADKGHDVCICVL